MKLKYRIQELKFYGLKELNLSSIFIAQYKIFGIWMNLDGYRGYFIKNPVTWCSTWQEAEKNVIKHRNIMKLSSHWSQKSITNTDWTKFLE